MSWLAGLLLLAVGLSGTPAALTRSLAPFVEPRHLCRGVTDAERALQLANFESWVKHREKHGRPVTEQDIARRKAQFMAHLDSCPPAAAAAAAPPPPHALGPAALEPQWFEFELAPDAAFDAAAADGDLLKYCKEFPEEIPPEEAPPFCDAVVHEASSLGDVRAALEQAGGSNSSSRVEAVVSVKVLGPSTLLAGSVLAQHVSRRTYRAAFLPAEAGPHRIYVRVDYLGLASGSASRPGGGPRPLLQRLTQRARPRAHEEEPEQLEPPVSFLGWPLPSNPLALHVPLPSSPLALHVPRAPPAAALRDAPTAAPHPLDEDHDDDYGDDDDDLANPVVGRAGWWSREEAGGVFGQSRAMTDFGGSRAASASACAMTDHYLAVARRNKEDWPQSTAALKDRWGDDRQRGFSRWHARRGRGRRGAAGEGRGAEAEAGAEADGLRAGDECRFGPEAARECLRRHPVLSIGDSVAIQHCQYMKCALSEAEQCPAPAHCDIALRGSDDPARAGHAPPCHPDPQAAAVACSDWSELAAYGVDRTLAGLVTKAGAGVVEANLQSLRQLAAESPGWPRGPDGRPRAPALLLNAGLHDVAYGDSRGEAAVEAALERAAAAYGAGNFSRVIWRSSTAVHPVLARHDFQSPNPYQVPPSSAYQQRAVYLTSARVAAWNRRTAAHLRTLGAGRPALLRAFHLSLAAEHDCQPDGLHYCDRVYQELTQQLLAMLCGCGAAT